MVKLAYWFMVAKSKKRQSSEQGSFLLLTAAFMLPVLLVLGTYTLDVLHFNETRSRAQHAVDQAALAASKKLPYTRMAESAALSLLERTGFRTGSRVVITPDDVQVEYIGQHNSLLARMASNGSTGYRVYSSAHINNKDVAIFMDTSSYLAPLISNDVADSWNTPASWPYAQYFKQKVNKQYAGAPVPHRILTQQCFNSAFSSLKEATIRLYDYYSSSGLNSVGYLTGPGNLDRVTMIKPLNSAYQEGIAPGEGRYDYFRSRYASDEMCLAAAQYELRHKGYNMPIKSTALPTTHYQGASFQLVNDDHELPVANLRHLAVRDIIWTTAVRREYGTDANPVQFPKIVDFRNVLNQTTNALLAAPYRADRRAVSNKQAAIAILMMGDLPWINEERIRAYPPGVTQTQINSIIAYQRQLHVNNPLAIALLRNSIDAIDKRAAAAQRQLQIYISFTRHLGNYPPEWYPQCVDVTDNGNGNFLCREFNADGEALESILKRFERQGVYSSDNLIIRVFRSPSTEGLARNLGAWLPLADRTVFKGN